MAVGSWQLTDVSGQLASGFLVTSRDVTPIFSNFRRTALARQSAVAAVGIWWSAVW